MLNFRGLKVYISEYQYHSTWGGVHTSFWANRVVLLEVKKAAAAAAAENITMAEVNWCGIRAGAYGEKGMRRQMEDETLDGKFYVKRPNKPPAPNLWW